jgi:uncharacterized protein (DUF433 family)
MLMPSEDRISRSPGVDGQTWITGHRVRVLDVVICYEHQGLTAEQIIVRYPTLSRRDVHIALNYYFDHIEEIQREIRVERAFEEEFRRTHTSLLDAKRRKESLEAAS